MLTNRLRFFRSSSRFAVVAIAAGVLGGCASMSPQECLTANWYSIGVEDGTHGMNDARFENRQADCAATVAQPDSDEYYQGMFVGLKEYCSVEGGLKAGQSGRAYREVCESKAENEFLSGYVMGMQRNR